MCLLLSMNYDSQCIINFNVEDNLSPKRRKKKLNCIHGEPKQSLFRSARSNVVLKVYKDQKIRMKPNQNG